MELMYTVLWGAFVLIGLGTLVWIIALAVVNTRREIQEFKRREEANTKEIESWIKEIELYANGQ